VVSSRNGAFWHMCYFPLVEREFALFSVSETSAIFR